ncbi:MAG: TonB-dependent receptor plug domain-containing protein [Bacteroidota bacterium]
MVYRFPSPLSKISSHIYLLLLLALCCGPLAYGQYEKNPVHDRILGKLSTYAEKNAPEKVYVQTDKDLYVNGETIWFKLYLIDGTFHTASQKSRVAYVELLNPMGKIVAQRKLYVENLGASGDIALDGEIGQGSYTLRAYTQYMGNEKNPKPFEKTIPIWVEPPSQVPVAANKTLKTSLAIPNFEQVQLNPHFFPEGGYLVAGLPSILAFEIKDNAGNSVSSHGRIVDDKGNVASYFQSYALGLGSVKFKPEANAQYYAVFSNNGNNLSFPLPLIEQKGYVLTVKNHGQELILNVRTNKEEGLKDVLLVGHLRGKLILEKPINTRSTKAEAQIRLLTKELQDGVAQFTLFGPNQEPLCERLVFIQNPENALALDLSSAGQELDYRNLANIAMEIKDKAGKPVPGELSLSVFKADNQLKDASNVGNIKSWLLLNSDLKGDIPDPDYFFEDNSASRKRQLDALMLTHGWRRFVWQDVLSGSLAKTPHILPEKGIMIKGNSVADKDRNRPIESRIKMFILEPEVYQVSGATDADGNFAIGPFVFQDSISVLLEGFSKAPRKVKEVHLQMNPVPYKTLARTKLNPESSKRVNKEMVNYIAQANLKKVTDFKYDPKVTQLKEVTVTTKKKSYKERLDEELDRATLYTEPSHRLYIDSLPLSGVQSALDILRNVPGVLVRGTYPNQTVQIRGALSLSDGPRSPLYLLNGMPVDSLTISQLTTSDILLIDVLNTSKSALFGSNGANGVISVFTPEGLNLPANPKKYPGVSTFKVPGFYKTREFYAPDYSSDRPEHEKPDYRTTLHWEPHIILDGKEKATLDFYTGDSPGEYIIRVEGLTEDGRPVSRTSRITVGWDGTKL